MVLNECVVLSLLGSWIEGSWGKSVSVGVWGTTREDVEDVAESRSLNIIYLRKCFQLLISEDTRTLGIVQPKIYLLLCRYFAWQLVTAVTTSRTVLQGADVK